MIYKNKATVAQSADSRFLFIIFLFLNTILWYHRNIRL